MSQNAKRRELRMKKHDERRPIFFSPITKQRIVMVHWMDKHCSHVRESFALGNE